MFMKARATSHGAKTKIDISPLYLFKSLAFNSLQLDAVRRNDYAGNRLALALGAASGR